MVQPHFSAGLRDRFPQRIDGAMDLRFRGSEGLLQDTSDLLELQTFDVAENQRRSGTGGGPGPERGEVRPPARFLQLLLRAFCRVRMSVRGLAAERLACVFLAARPVSRDVQSDLV